MSDSATNVDFRVGHPPKPRLVLRVGIVGHRPKPEKFPAALVPHVKQKLGEVFGTIDATLVAIIQKSTSSYSSEPHAVRLASGLAEGADQLAVEVKPEGWDLDAVLPFPRESYLADFCESAGGGKGSVISQFEAALAKAKTVVEAPDDPRIATESLSQSKDPEEYWRLRNEGYLRCGGFLLRQIDLLIAVWDGRKEAGVGGTAQVIRGAVNADIPVVWISSVESTYPRMLEEIDDNGRPSASLADCCRGALADAISTIVSPASEEVEGTSSHHADDPNVGDRLQQFFDEQWPRPCRWVTYDLFKRWIEGKKPRFIIPPEDMEGYKARWQPFLSEAPAAGSLGGRIAEILLTRYAWADALAVDFANRHRTAYFNCYLMAALAVFIALVGIFAHDWPSHNAELSFKIILVVIELLLILWIYHIVVTVRKSRWLEKWVEYRTLAEMLWGARFLAYLGEHGRVQRANEFESPRAAWLIWYLRSTIREIGIPHAVLDASYQRQQLVTVEKHIVNDQITYHRHNATTLIQMHHILRMVAASCFLATMGILALFFLAWITFALGSLWEGSSINAVLGIGKSSTEAPSSFFKSLGQFLYGMKNYVTFAAAFAPALGAAVAGIRESGDFERFSERSAKTVQALEGLKHEIAQAMRKLTLDATSDVIFSIAQILTEDLSAWNSVYGRKQLELPS
jgi:hypothetical protein